MVAPLLVLRDRLRSGFQKNLARESSIGCRSLLVEINAFFGWFQLQACHCCSILCHAGMFRWKIGLCCSGVNDRRADALVSWPPLSSRFWYRK